MFYYGLENNIFISNNKICNSGLKLNSSFSELKSLKADDCKNLNGNIFVLNTLPPESSRRSFCISAPSLLFVEKESLELLKDSEYDYENIPEWLLEKIRSRKVTSLNTSYPTWQEVPFKNNYINKVNIIGLGDVGGTLATGLRLMGADCISEIGIFDMDKNKIKRWKLELSQILGPDKNIHYPEIKILDEANLFSCDMFVFCVSKGVPEIGNEHKDVRLVQFEGNKKIISYYAKLARRQNFKGVFAVVSDPVDLLCKTVFLESNKSDNNTESKNEFDYMGIPAENIIGYGLGVMNARASYYAALKNETKHFLNEGRVFGPHGEGLIVADSLSNYNDTLSDELTKKTKEANLEIRSTGFKPFVAPALSSGCLSILATIKSEWNYNSTFLGGTFIGARNRHLSSGTEFETYKNMPDALYNKLSNTYNYLANFL